MSAPPVSRSICPTPDQLAKLLAGESVTVFLEDERLNKGKFDAMHEGKAMVCLGMHEYLDPETGMRQPGPFEWNEVVPPHSKGDVLWCQEATGLLNLDFVYMIDGSAVRRGLRQLWDSFNMLVVGEDVIPAEHMPKEAARLWVRVEDVGVERRFKEAVDPETEERLAKASWTWALALTPVEKPYE